MRLWPRGEGNLASLFVEKALNAEVWDVEGKRYIDFGSGIAVCNTGHTHPKVTRAVHEQIDRFTTPALWSRLMTVRCGLRRP